MDMITQSITAFLQPHTSSLSMPLVVHAMSCLMVGGFSGEDFDSVFNAQLDSLAISPQAKQGIIPTLLGIAKLVKVQSLGIANQWEHVSSGVESPLNHDWVLAICANGEPSWITCALTVTTKMRKEKDIQEKSVPG
ncbi:hypothetical protein EDB89DRAFT_1907309 [Lactarius sanguifluus]|nr:hypothetical protein EDB89DRAFT_1907309 [Lactarius sanguifluus]